MASKNNKRKSPSRRAGKFAVFLKKAALISAVTISVVAASLGLYTAAKAFYVRDIEVSGNRHLERSDIEGILKIRREPLLNLRLREIDAKLRANAWIKNTSLRWQLPGTLVVQIEEMTPKALLEYGGVTFLVNEEGNVMERLEDHAIPFLPVIREIDPRYKKVMTEAMEMVRALNEKNILSDRQVVEIGLDSYGLNMNIDGEFIKVGYGQYGEKFERWLELEPELRKRGVEFQYVDLRFKDSVIVKPLEEEKGKDLDKGDGKEEAKQREKVKAAAKEKRIS